MSVPHAAKVSPNFRVSRHISIFIRRQNHTSAGSVHARRHSVILRHAPGIVRRHIGAKGHISVPCPNVGRESSVGLLSQHICESTG
ncbi:hypothetical protein ID866_2500 [Astraeus odoratus]|nr:hypothetical protein ID866_2500 [Astraeus odoratus]